jgi:hypothetical protein
MKISHLLIGLAFVMAASFVMVSCSGDEYDQMTRSINDDSDGTYAKDRTTDQPCDSYDFKLADCLDACSCCDSRDSTAQGGDSLDQCVWYCDGLLLKINDIEHQAAADITNYKECVVGCFSICDKTNKETACYNECAHYLGN